MERHTVQGANPCWLPDWVTLRTPAWNTTDCRVQPAAVDILKTEDVLPRRVRLRQCKYLNNVIEQDHRTVKKRTLLAKGYGSFQSAWRTLEVIETISMIRKGRAGCVTKGDVVAEARFIAMLFTAAA